jgi:resuscitation-promoting factor RpfB
LKKRLSLPIFMGDSKERKRLYHSEFEHAGLSHNQGIWRIILGLALVVLTAACAVPQTPQGDLVVTLLADGSTQEVRAARGSSVQQVLTASGISLGALDRSEPPVYGVLSENTRIQVVRVREEFEVAEMVVPFQNQVLRNESMPEGETRLVQPGVNGLQEVTYRQVFEDGQLTSNTTVKTVVIKEAVPEIMMVGSQPPFTSFVIPGRLVYLLGGNAWIIEGSTGSRRPLITTGDLDGRVFSLSHDGRWLLFTRISEDEETINSLWAADLDEDENGEIKLVDLKVTNVVHFSGWKPGSTYTIAYSTVEPRASAPGWQANNDLQLLTLTSAGQVRNPVVELETNMGGTYGWWGMHFAWSPQGDKLAYARPDQIGLFNFEEGSLTPLLELVPLLTRSDWAWVPGISWGGDGSILFSTIHVMGPGAPSPEESPYFDIAAVPLDGRAPFNLLSQSGMFSYPLPSPVSSGAEGEMEYSVAYLQAVFPTQSETSRYAVALMDRDGSNRRTIFPVEGAPGIAPQSQWGVWSPEPLSDSGSRVLAVIYQDNLWFIDAETGLARQITGDDLITRVDWK